MSRRKFMDRHGVRWQVREESGACWRLEPIPENAGTVRIVSPPGYQPDPFELSEAELQRLLEAAETGPDTAYRPSPFKDDLPPPERPSPFRDDLP